MRSRVLILLASSRGQTILGGSQNGGGVELTVLKDVPVDDPLVEEQLLHSGGPRRSRPRTFGTYGSGIFTYRKTTRLEAMHRRSGAGFCADRKSAAGSVFFTYQGMEMLQPRTTFSACAKRCTAVAFPFPSIKATAALQHFLCRHKILHRRSISIPWYTQKRCSPAALFCWRKALHHYSIPIPGRNADLAAIIFFFPGTFSHSACGRGS